MSFSTYFSKLTRKNPDLLEDSNKITLKVGEFRKQLEKAFLAGAEDEKEIKTAAESFGKVKSPENSGGANEVFDSLFGAIFGCKSK